MRKSIYVVTWHCARGEPDSLGLEYVKFSVVLHYFSLLSSHEESEASPAPATQEPSQPKDFFITPKPEPKQMSKLSQSPPVPLTDPTINVPRSTSDDYVEECSGNEIMEEHVPGDEERTKNGRKSLSSATKEKGIQKEKSRSKTKTKASAEKPQKERASSSDRTQRKTNSKDSEREHNPESSKNSAKDLWESLSPQLRALLQFIGDGKRTDNIRRHIWDLKINIGAPSMVIWVRH